MFEAAASAWISIGNRQNPDAFCLRFVDFGFVLRLHDRRLPSELGLVALGLLPGLCRSLIGLGLGNLRLLLNVHRLGLSAGRPSMAGDPARTQRRAGPGQFTAAMLKVGRLRSRTGGYRWRLYRSDEDPQFVIEELTVPSWAEFDRAESG